MRSLKENIKAQVDLGIVLMIGIAFCGLMVIGYIIYSLKTQLAPTGAALNTITNITKGFDNAIALILVAITIFILALAISALLLLRGRQG